MDEYTNTTSLFPRTINHRDVLIIDILHATMPRKCLKHLLHMNNGYFFHIASQPSQPGAKHMDLFATR
jgi:hypothetical protein